MRRTYWIRHPRDFANEYTIGIATTREDAEQYRAEGYSRINRETALRALSQRDDAATEYYVSATVNGHIPEAFTTELAREIRRGVSP